MDKTPSQPRATLKNRRFVLKAVGGSAALVSVTGLAACGGDSEAPEAPAAARPEGVTGTGNATRMDEPADSSAATAQTDSSATSRMVEPNANGAQDTAAGEPGTAGQAPTGDPADMEQLDPADPAAEALGYTHDASDVDASEQIRYEEGQLCSNCTLFTSDSGEEWGPCSIFPGKLVNANGWCSTYTPKA